MNTQIWCVVMSATKVFTVPELHRRHSLTVIQTADQLECIGCRCDALSDTIRNTE